MRIRKALVAATVALVGALGGAFAVAAPASAANEDGLINTGEVVLWRDTGFTGPLFDEFFGLSDYRTKQFIGTSTNLNDNASSVVNYDPTYSISLYENINCAGASVTFGVYGSAFWFIGNLADYGLNNRLSSHCWFL